MWARVDEDDDGAESTPSPPGTPTAVRHPGQVCRLGLEPIGRPKQSLGITTARQPANGRRSLAGFRGNVPPLLGWI
ncbi:hypothetical protein ROHU_026649 [Labeo rohita]|uniref:Uncharacterized protein n=1 Tax=Labeo rohita TaxID=84645 RepID=A0A498MEI9_LABRO|nr:hypothetical protein ROHU_026649 [Labeo rohita]